MISNYSTMVGVAADLIDDSSDSNPEYRKGIVDLLANVFGDDAHEAVERDISRQIRRNKGDWS